MNLAPWAVIDSERNRLYQKLGERTRHYRKEQSLSQTELGKLVDLSRSSIVNIEKGRQHPPLHVIWDLAAALEVDLPDLIPDKREVKRPDTIDPELAAKIAEELDDGDAEIVRQLAEFIQTSRIDN